MASLLLKMSVSFDGYVASVDGSTDWVAAGRSGDGLRWTVETVSNAGAHLWVPPPTRRGPPTGLALRGRSPSR
jgi:hypothetical protein